MLCRFLKHARFRNAYNCFVKDTSREGQHFLIGAFQSVLCQTGPSDKCSELDRLMLHFQTSGHRHGQLTSCVTMPRKARFLCRALTNRTAANAGSEDGKAGVLFNVFSCWRLESETKIARASGPKVDPAGEAHCLPYAILLNQSQYVRSGLVREYAGADSACPSPSQSVFCSYFFTALLLRFTT